MSDETRDETQEERSGDGRRVLPGGVVLIDVGAITPEYLAECARQERERFRLRPDEPRKTYFNEELLTIEVWTGHYHYQVDLERCTDSASLLDWILHIQGKRFPPGTTETFLDCLEVACQTVLGGCLQAVFCPFEQDQRVDWRRRTHVRGSGRKGA